MELRPYQVKGLNQIRQAFASGSRSILAVLPTGGGKTVVLSQLIKGATDKGRRVLFLVHRRELLFQAGSHLDRIGVPYGVIMAGEDYEYGHQVDMATVQTIHRRLKGRTYDPANLIIVDEAHHSTSTTYLDVIRQIKLDHPQSAVIGFTATPCRSTGMGLGSLFDSMVVMSTISDLTAQGFLVPVRYYAPSEPDLTGVKITAGDYNEKQLGEVMAKPKLVGDIVEHWARLGQNRQTVVFTTTVAHSVAVCQAFNAVGVPADHVDGKTDKDERADILRRFRNGDTRVLVNCAVLTEGVDIPDISCVVMARPTKSLVLYLQTIGRGLRPSGDSDCIYIDHSGCVYEHGFVDEIGDWTLDENTKNGSKKNDARKKREARPITCEKCSCVYSGRLKCPDCGTIPDIKKMAKDVDFIDAELGEVCFKTKTAKVAKSKIEDKQRWYSEFLGYAKQKGFAQGYAAHKYRDLFGVWPNKLEKTAKEPTIEVLAWIRGQAARAAIAKQHSSKTEPPKRNWRDFKTKKEETTSAEAPLGFFERLQAELSK